MQLGATLCRVQREDHFAELTSKLRPDMYMLLYFKWMMTKDLLYGTGNCAQCYVAAGMEGALGENGNTYTCGWVPLLSTWNDHNIVSQLCCCAVTKSGSTLCDPMDSSMPGSPVLHHLPKCAQVHVYWIGDAIETSHSLSPPSPPAFNLSQHQDLFQWVSSLYQVAKVLELSPEQNKMLKKNPNWDLSDKEVTESWQKRTPGEGAVLWEALRWAWARGQWAPQPRQACPESWGQERPEGGRATSHRDPAGQGDKFQSNSTGVMGKFLL